MPKKNFHHRSRTIKAHEPARIHFLRNGWSEGFLEGGERLVYRVLKGPGGVQGEGVFLGNPKDSVREDWGTLGNIREPPPLGPSPLNNPIIGAKWFFENLSGFPRKKPSDTFH